MALATLLVGDGTIPETLLLQFSPPETEQVNWRAVGVVVDGGVSSTYTLSVGYREGPDRFVQALGQLLDREV